MNEKEIYKQLMADYDKLNEETKRAIIIYKSGLYYHINKISSIDAFLNKEPSVLLEEVSDKNVFLTRYQDFKKNIDNPKNIFLKYSIFNIIDFSDIYKFIDSIKVVYKIINDTKLYLPDKLTVYRGICSNDEISDISKSNLISTTIDPEETKPFLFTNKDKKNKLYVISLEQQTPVLISPFSIANVYDSEVDYLINRPRQLKLVNNFEQGQQEIILFKDTLDFKLYDRKTIDEYNLTIEKLSTRPKELNYNENNKPKTH